MENDKVKTLWDMNIQTDKVLEHSKQDIVILDKETRKCKIIDIACPFDIRMIDKEREKVDRYQDLKWELKRIWNCREARVIPIMIGALGTISRGFHSWLELVSSNIYFGTI